MQVLRKISLYFLLTCGTVLIAITLASLLANTSYWYVKILNFPRLTTLVLMAVCLILFAFVHHKPNLASRLFLAGLVCCLLVQAFILLPYTPLGAYTVEDAGENRGKNSRSVSILVANVYMQNRQAEGLIRQVRQKDPTLLLTMEVNDWWADQLRVLESRYPYRMVAPRDNTYGMILYSKYPLDDRQVHQLNQEGVPSFLTKVRFPDGSSFRLFTLHPVPPKPSEHPDNMGEKEVALKKASRILAAEPGPSLVAGDFNDVGWSYNSKQFEKISGLGDVRRGRGLFNTFNAHSWIWRWPLDYVYVSPEFKVVEVTRLTDFGSDHFPYFASLIFTPGPDKPAPAQK